MRQWCADSPGCPGASPGASPVAQWLRKEEGGRGRPGDGVKVKR